jgi:hypothetical protein
MPYKSATGHTNSTKGTPSNLRKDLAKERSALAREAGGDSSDEEGAHKAARAPPKPDSTATKPVSTALKPAGAAAKPDSAGTKPNSAAPKLPASAPTGGIQTTIKFRVAIREVTDADPLNLDMSVSGSLTRENAGGRYVFAPSIVFGGMLGVRGWIGKIMKVQRNGITTIKFNDGLKHFQFEYVLDTFKLVK